VVKKENPIALFLNIPPNTGRAYNPFSLNYIGAGEPMTGASLVFILVFYSSSFSTINYMRKQLVIGTRWFQEVEKWLNEHQTRHLLRVTQYKSNPERVRFSLNLNLYAFM